MLGLLVIPALVAFAASAPFASKLDGEWRLFKERYVKNYNANEEVIRRSIWEENVKYVQMHNLEADRGVHTYTVGINRYADMTVQEFVEVMNDYKMQNRTRGSTFIPASNTALPDTVDWRTKGYVTPVKNQLQCGSCWAFSSTGSLEGQHFKKTGNLVSLSEQNLVDCSWKEGEIVEITVTTGAVVAGWTRPSSTSRLTMASTQRPRTHIHDEQCAFSAANVGATDTGFMDIKKDSETDLQSAVATVGPISVAIDAGHKSFQMYKSGVYYEPQCNPNTLDHGVLAVGYGTDNGQDYWLVKNSWGTEWGTAGYIMMSRNRNNNCGIATQSSYPLV